MLQSEANGTQAIRKILSQITTPLSKAVEKWNNICGNLDWHTIYSSFKRSTSDTNLKWFQYRILCRILTTNDYLYERKVNDSDRCTFCKTERETIRHLLWDCTYTETLWRRILDWITNNTSHLRAFNITGQLVIFGVEDNVVTDRVLDLIMLMAKHYIFRCRCLKVTPNFFFKRSQAKSSHRETYLVKEGQLTGLKERTN